MKRLLVALSAGVFLAPATQAATPSRAVFGDAAGLHVLSTHEFDAATTTSRFRHRPSGGRWTSVRVNGMTVHADRRGRLHLTLALGGFPSPAVVGEPGLIHLGRAVTVTIRQM